MPRRFNLSVQRFADNDVAKVTLNHNPSTNRVEVIGNLPHYSRLVADQQTVDSLRRVADILEKQVLRDTTHDGESAADS